MVDTPFQIPNFANSLASIVQARQGIEQSNVLARREQGIRDAQPFIEPALKGDNAALGKVLSASPEHGASIVAALGRMDANQRAQTKEQADYAASSANAILQSDPKDRPAVYEQMYAEGLRRGYKMVLPPTYSPAIDGQLRAFRHQAIPVVEWFKQQEGMPQPMGGGPAPTGQGAPAGGSPDYGGAISRVESGGRYDAVGPAANDKGQRAYGKYQVMDFNIGPWTQEILGKAMTPQEYLANPQAQDAVFNGKFNQYVQKYGSPQAAARAWFAGEGGMNNPGAKDVLGTSVAQYESKFNGALGGGGPAPAQIPGPPTNLVPQGPPAARMPLGPIAQGDTPQADGSGTPLPPNVPPPPAARDLLQHVPPGWQMLGVKGVPAYDHAGRLLVRRPDGVTTSIEIPKTPVPTFGWQQGPDGRLTHTPGGPNDPETIKAQADAKRKAEDGGVAGPFPGKSVEASALNTLIADGTLSLNQAAQLAAGKTITNPADGSVMFMTPSGLFAKPPNGPAVPVGAPAQQSPPPAGPASPPTSLKLPPMPNAPPQAAAPPANPGMITITPPKPQTPNNEQARDQGFADRMSNSDRILGAVAGEGQNSVGRLQEKIPFGAGNFMQSKEYQSFKQARDDFINAQLRRESGSAIHADEYDKADKQYFPVPGDKPETIAQKALNRRIAVEAMIKSGGPSYRPRAAEPTAPPSGDRPPLSAFER